MTIIRGETRSGGTCTVVLPHGETEEQVKRRLSELGFFNFVVIHQ